MSYEAEDRAKEGKAVNDSRGVLVEQVIKMSSIFCIEIHLKYSFLILYVEFCTVKESAVRNQQA